MRNTQPWHAEALRMRAEGMGVKTIARKLGKSRTSVRVVVDERYYEAQLAANRQVKQRQRDRLADKPAPRFKEDRAGIAAYIDKPAPVRAVISLAVITMPALPDELGAKPQIRLAPTPRITVNEGAERIRQIHQRMLRRGMLADRGLVEEFGL